MYLWMSCRTRTTDRLDELRGMVTQPQTTQISLSHEVLDGWLYSIKLTISCDSVVWKYRVLMKKLPIGFTNNYFYPESFKQGKVKKCILDALWRHELPPHSRYRIFTWVRVHFSTGFSVIDSPRQKEYVLTMHDFRKSTDALPTSIFPRIKRST